MVRFFKWMMNLIKNLLSKTPRLNRDFEIYEGDNFTAIKIIRGKYKNILYQYDEVSIKETGLDVPILSFHYTIHESGAHTHESLKKNAEFHNLIGDIAVSLLTSKVVESEKYESDREDNIEEFGI